MNDFPKIVCVCGQEVPELFPDADQNQAWPHFFCVCGRLYLPFEQSDWLEAFEEVERLLQTIFFCYSTALDYDLITGEHFETGEDIRERAHLLIARAYSPSKIDCIGCDDKVHLPLATGDISVCPKCQTYYHLRDLFTLSHPAERSIKSIQPLVGGLAQTEAGHVLVISDLLESFWLVKYQIPFERPLHHPGFPPLWLDIWQIK